MATKVLDVFPGMFMLSTPTLVFYTMLFSFLRNYVRLTAVTNRTTGIRPIRRPSISPLTVTVSLITISVASVTVITVGSA